MTVPVPKTEADSLDRRSLHERIAADLRGEIMSGHLPPGANLPSTTQLKARFDTSNAEATVMVKAGHLYEMQYEFTPE